MDKKCDYCGENKAMKQIPNPNTHEDKPMFWDVCITCEEVIGQQQKLTMGAILKERFLGEKYGEKLISEAQQRLKEISYEADIPILSVGYSKDELSVTGEENANK